MFYYIQSTDPKSYGTVKFSSTVFTGNDIYKFRINQLSTVATFLITTEEDYITFIINNEPVTVFFKNNSQYELPYDLNELLHPTGITCDYNSEGTLTFKAETAFTIKAATHRVKLLTGLYHTQLPITGSEIIVASVPCTCYGNTLYLRSRISSVVGFNVTQSVSYVSLCYHVTEIFIPGVPVISKQPGQLIPINTSDLSNMEFTLVDFMNEPVVLKAPLRIVLELIHEDKVRT